MTVAIPERLRGHIAMLFANMIWGFMSPVVKGVLQSGAMTGLALSGIRILGGMLLFVLVGMALPRRCGTRQSVARSDYPKLFLASLLMISANQGLYIIGISYTTPVDSAVMSTTTPVFTLIFATLLIHMRLTWLKVIGVGLGIGGALLMVWAGRGASTDVARNAPLGDLMCMGAQMCGALYFVLFRDLINRYSPFTMMKWMFIFSSLTYVPFTIPDIGGMDISLIDSSQLMSIAYVIIFATFVGYLLIPYSQRLLKPTAVAMYTYFQPVSSSVLAAVMGLAIFGELKIAATLLIFAGVFCVARSR